MSEGRFLGSGSIEVLEMKVAAAMSKVESRTICLAGSVPSGVTSVEPSHGCGPPLTSRTMLYVLGAPGNGSAVLP